MDRIHLATVESLAKLRWAAIAVKRVTDAQCHVGVVYSDDESASGLSLLHLAWHFDLRCQPHLQGYHWVELSIPLPRLRQVAAFCRRLWRANPRGLPYALSQPDGCFDGATAQFVFGPTRLGLTCATFVVAVFGATGIGLVDLASWPVRPDDIRWQREVLAALAAEASAEHLDAVRGEVGATRIRPEEVAGAGLADDLPATFLVAEAHAQAILACLGS